MKAEDIILISLIVIGLLVVIFYFLNRKAYQKMNEAQTIIEKNKTTSSIFVIDKKKDKPGNVNLPKAIMAQIPKWQTFRKMYFVKAKIGPQIITLMCDGKVYNQLPLKKNVKVDLAGIYIVEVKGAKGKNENPVKESKFKGLFNKAKK